VHKKILLIILTLLFIHNGYAVQLGKINVKSNQNSLFDAEIILMLDEGDDIESMKASIASQEIYSSQGMQRKTIHSDIKITLSNIDEDKALMSLRSTKPVKESFIDLLIQIDSPKGKNLKEYTVLLDQPLEQTKKLSKKNTEIKKIESPQEIKSKKQENSQVKTKTLITKPGKTLFQIARENSISGITTQQYAVAVFQLNPKAFSKGNINGLNKGKTITLPKEEYFKNLPHLKARKILKEQNLLWSKKASKKSVKKVTIANKVNNKNNQNEIKKLNSEIEKLKEALKKQKTLTAQIESTAINNNSVEEFSDKPNNERVKVSEGKKETVIQPDVIDYKIEEQDFVSSIAIEDETIIKEVVIDDVDGSSSNSRSGLIYFLLLLFAFLGGLLVFLSKKRAKLRSIIEEVSPRTSVDEYIQRKKIEQEFNRK
jgi:FimV-like protein